MTRAVGALVVLVAVQLSVPGLYLPPVFKVLGHYSAPDDHFTAGPHCGVIVRALGALVVPVATQLSVLDCICRQCLIRRNIASAPDDHFTPSPNCRVSRRA